MIALMCPFQKPQCRLTFLCKGLLGYRVIGASESELGQESRDAHKIRRLSWTVPKHAIVEISSHYCMTTGEKPAVKPQSIGHGKARLRVKVQCPDCKQVKTRRPCHS